MPVESNIDKGEEEVCRVDGGTNAVSVIVGFVAVRVGEVSCVTIEEPICRQPKEKKGGFGEDPQSTRLSGQIDGRIPHSRPTDSDTYPESCVTSPTTQEANSSST